MKSLRVAIAGLLLVCTPAFNVQTHAVSSGEWAVSSTVETLTSQNNLSLDVSPPQTIAFPVHDVTLFAHAGARGRQAEDQPFVIQWTQTGGPAPATLSAPWALITSATFSTAGAYTFSLTVSSDGSTASDSTTVYVLEEASQTAFYVDPTYIGGGSDGSAAHPWTSLATGVINAQWTAINGALASNNVIVYFSSRQAGSDAPEVEQSGINVFRTDGSSNRLTLDGMSKYNANDAAPVWMDYAGSTRFLINLTSGPISIGVRSTNTQYPANNTTIRGFEVNGTVSTAGDYTVLEYIYAHDLVGSGPTFLFNAADNNDCTAAFGNRHAITFRNLRVERGIGEGIYINGNDNGGCPAWGNTHSDILVENNVIIDPGANGGRGDGIDLRAGLTNVTIRRNTIQQTDKGVRASSQGAKGIMSIGVFGPATTKSNFLVEDNFLNNTPSGMVFGYINGAIIRNNILANSSIGGFTTSITAYYNGTETSPINFNINLYNNTIYYGSIVLNSVNGATVQNNLITRLRSETQLSAQGGSVGIDSDYNSLVSTAGIQNWTEGTHSLYLARDENLFANVSSNDFHLVPGAAPATAGIALSPTFPDYAGESRPDTSPWSIGAYNSADAADAPTTTNQPPVVNAGPDQTITLPSGASLSGTATDDGLPSGGLTASWSKVTGPGTVTFANGAAATTTASFSAAGSYTLRLTATDSSLSSSDDVVIVVNPQSIANLAPVVNAGSDQTITLGTAATLSGTATDDGLPTGLTTSWSTVSGPGTVTFGKPSALTTSVTFSAAGTYTLRLTANDGVLSSTDDVVIVVNACGTVVAGSVTVTADATDDVGVVGVQFQLDGANLGPELKTAPFAMPWTTTNVANGCHVLTAIARDAAGNKGTASASVAVNNP